MISRNFWLTGAVLLWMSGCVSTPSYLDPVSALRSAGGQSGPLGKLKLGIVHTENAKRAFDYIEENKRLAKVAYPLATSDIGADLVTVGLQEILEKRFKSVVQFESIEAALQGEADLVMSVDLLCTLGQRSFNTTTVDLTGTLMNRDQKILDTIEGGGKATASPWSYGFRKVLQETFSKFADNLDHSSPLIAFAERRVISAPVRGELGPPEASELETGDYYQKSWAVVIGINNYDLWPSLEYAVNDARAVKQKLEAIGFDEVIEVLDKDATRTRILTLLASELPKKVGAEDRVVLFFAGHGQTETLTDGKEQGYIIPVDGDITNYFTTAISMDQIRALSRRIPAKHMLYMMDACYSGLGFTRAAGIDPGINGYIQKITGMRSIQMITAGGKGEQVMEREGHGVFTEYLLRGLDGEADRDNDNVVTASELGAFLKPQVSRASNNLQTPQFGRLDGEGDVVFVVKP
ncbi:MAG: caspase family protein [Candidatus Omnitrophota bacterium]|nr:caspase family protein [Candidatus Omnitrophota bacterium]